MASNKDNPLNTITLREIFKNPPTYHNVAADIAEHATSLLLGQGYSVDILRNGTKDEQLENEWKIIEKRVNFSKLLERNEYDLSINGFKVLTIDKAKNGDLLIMENDDQLYSKVATIQQISEVAAVVYKKYTIDQTAWVIKEKWDTKKVERQWFFNDKEVVVEDLKAKIPKELQLPEVWEHNLGILPVVLLVNKNRNINHINEYWELADTYTAREQIRMLNLLTNQQVKEALLNITKIFGEFDINTMKKISENFGARNNREIQLLLNQLFIEVKQRGDMSGAGKPVEILQANPAFEKYILAREDALKSIWRAAGYTYNAANETTNSNAETLYANAFDLRTTKKKKTTRQQDYADLIAKCLVALGKINWEQYVNGEIEVVFNIKENAVQTPNQIADYIIKLVDAGLMSRARALMKIEGIPNIEQAEVLIKEADEDTEARQELMGERLDDLAGNSQMTNSVEPREENK